MDAVSLLEIFQLPFMARALATVAILAVASGVVGLFISFRDLEFVSDGLVHAVFPGLVVGNLLGGVAGVLPGAVVAALAAAVLLTVLGRRPRLGSDAGIAVVLTSAFSLGVVLVSRQENYVSQLEELLFGRLLTVTPAQLVQIAVVAAVAIALVLLTARSQLIRAFDPDGFRATGARPALVDLVLNIAVALLIVAGVQALGNLMVLALLTVPMAISRLVTRRFAWLVPLAVLTPLLAGAAGLWLTFTASVVGGHTPSPGAVVVLLLVGLYGLAVLWSLARRRGARSRVSSGGAR
ncbi:metal ABC transporter permease [Leucobacter sp. M11]|uniref:metal ABC transporter permease n=1 Tax=Leucobacter sp. M11 TaxID=2993565 RepID=UPI002D7F4448|nr:metal ABC transporter permease [Leucobacter sp. M11]MEB4614855.1 metal ABC transporter permease [Leucobacter sp. M11]